MITGYDQPTKPIIKVLLSEYPPLLATLPPQIAKEMMCEVTLHILCSLRYGSLRPKSWLLLGEYSVLIISFH